MSEDSSIPGLSLSQRGSVTPTAHRQFKSTVHTRQHHSCHSDEYKSHFYLNLWFSKLKYMYLPLPFERNSKTREIFHVNYEFLSKWEEKK